MKQSLFINLIVTLCMVASRCCGDLKALLEDALEVCLADELHDLVILPCGLYDLGYECRNRDACGAFREIFASEFGDNCSELSIVYLLANVVCVCVYVTLIASDFCHCHGVVLPFLRPCVCRNFLFFFSLFELLFQSCYLHAELADFSFVLCLFGIESINGFGNCGALLIGSVIGQFLYSSGKLCSPGLELRRASLHLAEALALSIKLLLEQECFECHISFPFLAFSAVHFSMPRTHGLWSFSVFPRMLQHSWQRSPCLRMQGRYR